jgi:putative membrane protein
MAKLKSLILVSIMAFPLQLSAQAKTARYASGAKAPGNENAAQSAQAQKQLEQRTLAKLHQINQHEIQAGQLAQQRSQSPELKHYGETLVNDHRQLDTQVTAFAERNDMTLPSAQQNPSGSDARVQSELQKMEQAQQAHAQHLESISNDQFDREFASMMLDGHQQAIQLVKDARSQSKDVMFKSLLADALPVLKRHLETARQLQRQASSKKQ